MDHSPLPVHAHLVRLDGFALATFVSPGSESQGEVAAARAGRALNWLSELFGTRPQPPLFVVGPEDWDAVASVPLYGLPHAFNDRVVIGTEPAEFWQQYLDIITPRLPSPGSDQLREVYGDPPDLGGRFADLLVAHELTHLFHELDDATGATDFPRLWLAELFANLGLYGYLAEHEPGQLPVVQTICRLSVLAGADPWPVRDLNRMDEALADGPLNYVWFELGLVLVAKRLWEAAGQAGFAEVRSSLRHPELTDDQILDRLAAIDAGAAAMIGDWPT